MCSTSESIISEEISDLSSLGNWALLPDRNPGTRSAIPQKIPARFQLPDRNPGTRSAIPQKIFGGNYLGLDVVEDSSAYSIDDSPTHPGRDEKLLGLKDLLSATSQNSSAEILNMIRPRILELSEAALEEKSEGQLPLLNDSYLGLVAFLNRFVGLGLNSVPGLILTYEGNIRAEWRSSPDERLALEFLDSARLKFVFFYLDFYFPARVLRISGSGSALGFLTDHPRALEFLRNLGD